MLQQKLSILLDDVMQLHPLLFSNLHPAIISFELKKVYVFKYLFAMHPPLLPIQSVHGYMSVDVAAFQVKSESIAILPNITCVLHKNDVYWPKYI